MSMFVGVCVCVCSTLLALPWADNPQCVDKANSNITQPRVRARPQKKTSIKDVLNLRRPNMSYLAKHLTDIFQRI